MTTTPAPLKSAMAMIERAANAGCECPTNSEIAAAMGRSSMASGADALSTLETLGMTSVVRGRCNRVVTITATGKRTAGTVRKPIGLVQRKPRVRWTRARDSILMEAISQDMDFEQAANLVGYSPEQCAARFDELASRFGRQAA